MLPDTRWADLATVVPGGFAGTFYDSTHTLILMLAEPAQASAAKRALAEHGLALQQATVRPARWNFAQLVDWFDYILPRLGVPAAADKDEALNRIRFSVTSIELRDRVIAALSGAR